MPIDRAELEGLSATQKGVMMELYGYIWDYCRPLPDTVKGRAEVAGVHVRTWKAMEPRLEELFDIDDDGRWRHFDLEAERMEIAESSAKLSERNAEKSRKRWKDVRVRREETARTEEAARNAAGNAGGNPRGIAGGAEKGVEGGRSGMPFGEPHAPSASGQSDGLIYLQPKEKIEETDGRTDAQRAAGAGVGSAAGNSAEASGSLSSQPESDGKPANGAATPDAGSTPAGSIGPASGEPAGNSKLPSDADIICALRDGAGDKIPAHLLTRDGIAPIRELILEGCDWARDVAPAFIAGTRGLKRPLDSLRAGFLHDKARASRNEARTKLESQRAVSSKVAVEVGTPEWRAWQEHLGKKSLPTADVKVDGRPVRGWHFDSRWPPGREPTGSRRDE